MGRRNLRLLAASVWYTIGILCFITENVVSKESIVDIFQLKPPEFAIVQFDSRELDNYWLTSPQWNHLYCKTHGHKFIYYTLKTGCHHGGTKLANAWCKVKSMIQATHDFPHVKIFIYLDSDAVVDKAFSHLSLNQILSKVQKNLQWNLHEKPIIFNQDGQSWWCTLITQKGYNMCLNSGTVVWYRHPRSEFVLKNWWDSALDEELEGNPLKRRFRLNWPWEQDRQMAIYNRTSHYIQIASHPEHSHLQHRKVEDENWWCLSHLPQEGCFISHYCANEHMKNVMNDKYRSMMTTQSAEFEIHHIRVE